MIRRTTIALILVSISMLRIGAQKTAIPDLEALKAHLKLDLPGIANDLGVDDIDFGFGPLFSCHIPGNCSNGFAFNVNVFNDSWQIPFAPVVGDAFIVRVPEPTTLLLFGFGFALLGASALRRRRQDQA